MDCPNCNKPMECRTDEAYHYLESGLDYVYLLGVEICRCKNCDEEIVTLPKVAQLQSLIGRCLIEQDYRLTGREVRFLRKDMGLTAARLAKRMKVAPATISRWENDKQVMDASNDRLLRLIYAVEKLSPDQMKKFKARLDADVTEPPAPVPRMTIPIGGWLKGFTDNCRFDPVPA